MFKGKKKKRKEKKTLDYKTYQSSSWLNIQAIFLVWKCVMQFTNIIVYAVVFVNWGVRKIV